MARFFVIAALAVAWFAAFAIELLARVTQRAYAGFGADLPAPTVLTFSVVQSYGPWIAVAAATVIVIALLARKSAHLQQACAAIALVTALTVSWAALSVAMPGMTLCGSVLPDWHVPGATAADACRAARN